MKLSFRLVFFSLAWLSSSLLVRYSWVYRLLNNHGKAGHRYGFVMSVIIILNVGIYILSSINSISHDKAWIDAMFVSGATGTLADASSRPPSSPNLFSQVLCGGRELVHLPGRLCGPHVHHPREGQVRRLARPPQVCPHYKRTVARRQFTVWGVVAQEAWGF